MEENKESFWQNLIETPIAFLIAFIWFAVAVGGILGGVIGIIWSIVGILDSIIGKDVQFELYQYVLIMFVSWIVAYSTYWYLIRPLEHHEKSN